MSPAPHISPKIRAYGKARIDITRRARDEAEWRALWKEPSKPYPFSHSPDWKFNIVYKVDDFAAEIGFFIDLLGFPVWAFSPSYAQFTSPSGEFTFSVAAAQPGEQSTPDDALRLQFNVLDLSEVVTELELRGVTFDQPPTPVQEGSSACVASFRTPHGIAIDLFGELCTDEMENEASGLSEADAAIGNDPPADLDASFNPQRSRIEPTITKDNEADKSPEEESPQATPSAIWRAVSRVSSRFSSQGNEPRRANAGRGNGELTYAPLKGDEFDADEEEYP